MLTHIPSVPEGCARHLLCSARVVARALRTPAVFCACTLSATTTRASTPQSGWSSFRSFYTSMASSVEQVAKQQGYDLNLGSKSMPATSRGGPCSALVPPRRQALPLLQRVARRVQE